MNIIIYLELRKKLRCHMMQNLPVPKSITAICIGDALLRLFVARQKSTDIIIWEVILLAIMRSLSEKIV